MGECVDADPRGPRGTMLILRIDFEVRAAFIDDVVGSILLWTACGSWRPMCETRCVTTR